MEEAVAPWRRPLCLGSGWGLKGFSVERECSGFLSCAQKVFLERLRLGGLQWREPVCSEVVGCRTAAISPGGHRKRPGPGRRRDRSFGC